jgi:hypothetical protein
MTYLFKLARRGARLRAPLLSALVLTAACNTDQLTNSTDESLNPDATSAVAAPMAPSFAAGFRGGIPFGMSAQPNGAFGDVFNGAFRNIWPEFLREELAEIKSRGGKVVLTFAGHEEHYKDRTGHFDMGKWKARVDRFKSVDFSSYINDGTIVGHYLIDEPYDAFNWGDPVPGSVVEEMARYSKQLWPNLVTIVRAQPNQVRWNGTYRYLDAAWAQYTYQKGDIARYIRENVADAQAMGLGLVVGLNVTKGSPSRGELTGRQIEDWGSVLLSSTYPCAFISWQYNERHLSQSDVKAAMAELSRKAQDRPTRTCKGSNGGDAPPPPLPPPPPTLPGASGIVLQATRQASRGVDDIALRWSGATSRMVDLYRNGSYIRTTINDGRGLSAPAKPGKYSYKICEAGKSRCSNVSTVTIS